MMKPVNSLRRMSHAVKLLSLCGLPLLMGADGGGGCGGTFNSKKPAPDVAGSWAITYGTTMDVKVKVEGTTYTQTLGPTGGVFTIMHKGAPFAFNVDCARPEVVCPSEVWPTQVSIDQRDPTFQYRMWVKIPTQTCSGQTMAPLPSECGMGTNNPECKPVCTGTVVTSSADAFGLIREGGTGFDLLLGGGFATNGINCALLALSVATADLRTKMTGSQWDATDMSNGQVKTGYAGGCLWGGAGQPTTTVTGASVEISVPFTGKRL